MIYFKIKPCSFIDTKTNKSFTVYSVSDYNSETGVSKYLHRDGSIRSDCRGKAKQLDTQKLTQKSISAYKGWFPSEEAAATALNKYYVRNSGVLESAREIVTELETIVVKLKTLI